MVIRWLDTEGVNAQAEPPKARAAAYVRMSTDNQQFSTDNQLIAIQRYADGRGYEIVRTYADEGKSGLNVDGRPALQKLLADVENGRADFGILLVYDVSRLGRFQDPDEAALYELRCRRAGLEVHYCAEQFENDGSIGSSIIKTVKRAMAGEYSRELSVKVFAGQANLIRLGFRQGGAAGFGLRRMLVDQAVGFEPGQCLGHAEPPGGRRCDPGNRCIASHASSTRVARSGLTSARLHLGGWGRDPPHRSGPVRPRLPVLQDRRGRHPRDDRPRVGDDGRVP